MYMLFKLVVKRTRRRRDSSFETLPWHCCSMFLETRPDYVYFSRRRLLCCRPTTYLFMVDMLGHIYFAAWALFYMPSSLSQPLSGGGRMEYGALSGSDADEGYVTLAGVDNPDVTAGVCPERRSNLVQCMLFSWVTPVMHTGHNRPLRDEDVWSLDDNDRSATVFRKFQAAWSAEFQKAEPSLMRALWVCYGVRFMLVGTLFKMVNDLSQFVGPLALNALLSSLERGQPLRESFVYGVAIFVGLIGGTLAENQYFQKVMRVGYQLRSSITSALFLKSLHMSPSVSEEIASKGKITNLVSSDVEQLQATCQNFHNIWSSPLRIVISMVLLYQQLGIASVVGLLVLLLVLPIQALVMRRIAFLSKTMMGKSDERVKLLSEILSAMDVVKCYVWEGSFQEKVSAIRTEELKWLRKNSYLVAVSPACLVVSRLLLPQQCCCPSCCCCSKPPQYCRSQCWQCQPQHSSSGCTSC
eukprot:jgi/Mesvir1/28441/Mv15863-RA.2